MLAKEEGREESKRETGDIGDGKCTLVKDVAHCIAEIQL